jgi:lysozyme family protein
VSATPAQAFTVWCRFLAPTEGGLSVDPDDPGNWTSGMPGVGTLAGTKFGISAASYPTLDIAGLTEAVADGIRKTDYWDKVHGDQVLPSIAFVLADAAYNSGPLTAIRWLQTVLRVTVDGVWGARTQAALVAATAGMNPDAFGLNPLEEFLAAYMGHRLLFDAGLGLWAQDQAGWVTRCLRLLVLAQGLA